MIQRIQSVYFLIAALLDAGVFFNKLYDHAIEDPQQWIGTGFTVAVIVGGVFALICIFLFNSRRIQITWSTAAIFFQTIALGWGVGILISLGGFGTFLWPDVSGVLMLLVSLIGIIFARHKIRKDQRLVDSMDRIR